MAKYIAKRLLIAAITLLVILFILFLMLEFMPGTPFNDEKLTAAQRAILEAKYGLDQPIFIRFFNYIRLMLQGDFGISYTIQKNMPVAQMLSSRMGITLRIGLQAVVLGSLLGLLLGIIAAIKHNSIFDVLATTISVLGVSVPSYVFALVLMLVFGSYLKWLPILYSGKQPFLSTIMPTISLSMFTLATIARFSRSEMIEVLGSEYLQLAKSKGLNKQHLIVSHALRNALIPIITVLAPLIVGLMTGSLVVEKIFSVPGLGSLMVTAIQVNDYNVVIAIAFIYSVMFIVTMLIVDILYGVIDPRIRLVKGAHHE
ncbi:MAG: ABC transporter permease [Erysipelotrichaceae bacterium]